MPVFSKFCWALMLGVVLLPIGIAGVPAAEEGQKGEAHGDPGERHETHIDTEGVSTDASEFKSDLAIFTLVVFLLLLGILGKFAWGPIVAGLEKREAGIRQNIDDAEAARLKAEQMLAAHAEKLDQVQDEIREIIAEARRDAEHTKQDIVNTAQREAEVSRQRAIVEIERAKDAALKELFDTAAAQVADATEHVLSRSLNDDDQNRLIEEALSQFRQN
jgi:F-type H+-transporting ATPase subunit b